MIADDRVMFTEERKRSIPRILFGLAAAGFLVSTFLPWAVGEAAGQPQKWSAYEGGEGVWLVILAGVLGALGASGILAEARSRLLQLIPLLIVVISAFMWQGAETQAHYSITFWKNQLGTGDTTVIRWICLAAIATLAVGWVLLEIWRPTEIRARTPSILRELSLSPWSLATLIVAGALGLLGGILAVNLVIKSFGPNLAIFGLLAAVIGIFVGGALGVRLVRWFRSVVSRA